MKSIEVVAAIIKKENKILATKRGYGEFINMWEFPGGKIESGETNEAALIREIKEELDADIKIDEFALTVEYTYPTFHLTMHCYICSLKDSITLLEHNDAKWLEKNEFNTVNWLPADIEVIDFLKNYL
ncbi:CTP pyrophosphohydrolase [Methanobrevibacter woesei]|uniref:8-oxo-dGTP diphosphatase n=1 Tax=Methanobrevibacter woesei TaxID=190976 RepID=A0A2U1S8H8_9EURY|nr:(deoxy)nucleoside triphosphate pyrophosphohydrolase [Methanobrevibacter woesei]MCI7291136.1 (deoxy)nucleoside triphosphate pyrophosphohydrolase [Methanobrevibacter woesei]PWB86331.1 CTP pyrophosphohydrolase [Methanobrevibacter woesei]